MAESKQAGTPVLFLRLPQKNWREFSTLQEFAARSGANFIDLGGKLPPILLRPQSQDDEANGLIRFLERYSVIWKLIRKTVRNLGFRYPVGDWWLRNEAILEAIMAESKQAGTPVLFLRLPQKDWREFSTLREFAARTGANFIDLGGPAARPSYDVHFVDDGHIDEGGHRFVANELYQWVRDNLR